MEKKYPLRIWMWEKKIEELENGRAAFAHPVGDSNEGDIEYLSKEEHDAIVQNLVEALETIHKYRTMCIMGPTDEICCDIYEERDGFDAYRAAFSLGSNQAYIESAEVAREALENYKKQSGVKDEKSST